MEDLRALLDDFAHNLVDCFICGKQGEIGLSDECLKDLINDYVRNCDPLFWPISSELVQQEAEQEIKRRLTDIELNRLKEMFYDDDDLMWKRMEMIRDAVLVAIDNSKGQWEGLDKDFEEENKLKNEN